MINVTEFGIEFRGNLQVNSKVEESGTGKSVEKLLLSILILLNRVMKLSCVSPGITVSGTTTARFASDYVNVNFEDTPNTYKPGMVFKGKVTAALRSFALLLIIE